MSGSFPIPDAIYRDIVATQGRPHQQKGGQSVAQLAQDEIIQQYLALLDADPSLSPSSSLHVHAHIYTCYHVYIYICKSFSITIIYIYVISYVLIDEKCTCIGLEGKIVLKTH